MLVALTLGATTLATSAMAADVTPAQSYQMLKEYLHAKHPNIPLSEYNKGAYIFDKDKMQQYKDIMEFPPYLDAIDAGEALWNKDKAVLSKCLGSKVSAIRTRYPYFDNKTNQVVTLEGTVEKCRADAGLKPYKNQKKGKGDIARLSAYFASQAHGKKINVVINSDGARKAFEAGQKLYITPRGMLGLACAKCHTYNAGNKARANFLSANLGTTAHFPVWRAKWNHLGTLENRFIGCWKNMRAKPTMPQSTASKNLEFFMAYMSNGYPINGPGYRE